MSRSKHEEALLTPQPIDKIDKNLRHMFGLLVEKNWSMASAIATKMAEGEPEVKQLAEGFQDLIKFLRALSSGKELKAAVKYIDSIVLNDELEHLLPPLEADEYASLKADIEKNGIIAPLIVQDGPGGLLLIDGYTRYRIIEELGRDKVPVVAVGSVLDPKTTALMVNLSRRHLTKDRRDAIIKALPVPAPHRPKKGEKVITKKELAKELAVSESTITRARKEKRVSNDTLIPKSKRPKKICTSPDSLEKPAKVEEIQNGWIPLSKMDIEGFLKMGFFKGCGFYMDVTPAQFNLDYMVRNIDGGMQEMLSALKKAGLEDQIESLRMTVTFDAKKK